MRRAAPPRRRPLPPPPQGRLFPLPHACRADGRIARCSDGLFRTATRASSGTTRGPQCSASAARTTAPVQAALAHHPSPPSSAVGRGADAPGSRPASAHTRIPQRLPTRALPTGRRRVRVAWNGRAPAPRPWPLGRGGPPWRGGIGSSECSGTTTVKGWSAIGIGRWWFGRRVVGTSSCFVV